MDQLLGARLQNFVNSLGGPHLQTLRIQFAALLGRSCARWRRAPSAWMAKLVTARR
jgi:hypothetical protein